MLDVIGNLIVTAKQFLDRRRRRDKATLAPVLKLLAGNVDQENYAIIVWHLIGLGVTGIKLVLVNGEYRIGCR